MDATSLTGKMYACLSTKGTTGFSMEENIVELPWVLPSYSSRLTNSVLRAFSLKKVYIAQFSESTAWKGGNTFLCVAAKKILPVTKSTTWIVMKALLAES